MRKKISGVFLFVILLLTLTACGKNAANQWQEQYDLGQKYLLEEDYEAAIVAFTAAIEIEPNDIRTYTGLIQAYMGLEDYDTAVSATDEGLAIMTVGEQEQAEGAVDDFVSVAIGAYETVKDVDSQYHFWDMLADYYADTENEQQIQESAAEALYDLGQSYLEAEDYENAIAAFEKSLTFDLSNADAYVGLMEAYTGLGDLEKAQEYADEGYELTGDERLLLQNEEEVADAQDDAPGITLADITESPSQSGSCGPNAVWSYYEGIKALVISGSGEVQDYDGEYAFAFTSSPVYSPWYDFQSDIQYLIIDEGITKIGNNVFYGYSSGYQYISLPSTLTEMSDYAFYFCSNVIAFSVDADNPFYFSDHGVLYKKDSAGNVTLLRYPHEKTASSYTVLAGTTQIMEEAFAGNDYICSVEIPGTVTEIQECVFEGCSSLSDVSLTDGLTRIASSAFWLCDSIESLEIPATVTDFTTELTPADAWIDAQDGQLSLYFFGETAPLMDTGITGCRSNVAQIIIYYPAGATGWDAVQQQINASWAADIISFETWTPTE